jgi:hypothetical protein
MSENSVGGPVVRFGSNYRNTGEIWAEPVLGSHQRFRTRSIAPKNRYKGLPPWPEIALIASTRSNKGEA